MKSGKISISVACGLIAGLALILLVTILYLGGIESYLGYYWLGWLVLIGAAITGAALEKKARDGYLEFRDALKAAFTVFVIAMLLQSLYSWILMNYIDRGFRDAVERVTLDKTEKFMQGLKIDQDTIDKSIDEQRGKNQYSLPKILMGLCFTYIVCFLVSLLIAAIIKKKKPEFHDTAFK
jgi:hypothetical protein